MVQNTLCDDPGAFAVQWSKAVYVPASRGSLNHTPTMVVINIVLVFSSNFICLIRTFIRVLVYLCYGVAMGSDWILYIIDLLVLKMRILRYIHLL